MYAQLIFSLARYEAVIDAYLDGLEACGLSDLSRVTSVASFFVSRVDTLVDKMLEKIGTPEALDLRGKVPTTCLNFSTPPRMLREKQVSDNLMLLYFRCRLQMHRQLWLTSFTRRNFLALDGRLW